MEWFDRIADAARAVPLVGAGALPLAALAAVAREALSGYAILYSDGAVARILGDDLRGNLAKMDAAAAALGAADVGAAAPGAGGPAAAAAPGAGGSTAADAAPAATLGALLRAAALAPGGARGAAGVWGALWVARTLGFVAELLRALGADAALPISAAGRATYARTLAPYHAPVFGWLVSWVVGWAPTRAWVLAHKLGGADNAAASAACARAAAALAPLAAAALAVLAAEGADFPDRMSALPFGL
jgi:hypothetical protein